MEKNLSRTVSVGKAVLGLSGQCTGACEGETTEFVNNHACILGAARDGLSGMICVWGLCKLAWRGKLQTSCSKI